MARESRGLGRGLEALLGARTTPGGVVPAAATAVSSGGGTLPVAAIRPGASQPRKSLLQQPLEELAASIKANGVIQPIVVRRLSNAAGGGAAYEIVAGERRWQAAKLAGLTDIPVVVRELSDSQAVAVALIENIQREELTPAEEARALQRLIGEFELTHQEVAEAVGRSRAAVSNLIRLLDLPEEIVALIDSKALSMGHARALLGLESDGERIRVGKLVAERGLSVRETEGLVRRALSGAGAEKEKPKVPELSVIQQVLKTESVSVTVQQRASGAARIVIDVTDAKTKDAVIEAIRGIAEDAESE